MSIFLYFIIRTDYNIYVLMICITSDATNGSHVDPIGRSDVLDPVRSSQTDIDGLLVDFCLDHSLEFVDAIKDLVVNHRRGV
jgi:hypothetical protein